MKKLIILLIAIILISNSGKTQPPVTFYKYTYSLEGADLMNDMFYEDSLISVTFEFGDKEIGFKISNRLKEPLRIIWDETMYIDGNEAQKVIHSGTKYNDRNNTQLPTLIPPDATISDVIIPANKVFYFNIMKEWRSHNLFPASDMGKPENQPDIKALIGHQVSIFMTIKRNSDILSYNWKFIIKDVQPDYSRK